MVIYLCYLVSFTVRRISLLTGVPVEGLIGREAGLSPVGNKVKEISLPLLSFSLKGAVGL